MRPESGTYHVKHTEYPTSRCVRANIAGADCVLCTASAPPGQPRRRSATSVGRESIFHNLYGCEKMSQSVRGRIAYPRRSRQSCRIPRSRSTTGPHHWTMRGDVVRASPTGANIQDKRAIWARATAHSPPGVTSVRLLLRAQETPPSSRRWWWRRSLRCSEVEVDGWRSRPERGS